MARFFFFHGAKCLGFVKVVCHSEVFLFFFLLISRLMAVFQMLTLSEAWHPHGEQFTLLCVSCMLWRTSSVHQGYIKYICCFICVYHIALNLCLVFVDCHLHFSAITSFMSIFENGNLHIRSKQPKSFVWRRILGRGYKKKIGFTLKYFCMTLWKDKDSIH